MPYIRNVIVETDQFESAASTQPSGPESAAKFRKPALDAADAAALLALLDAPGSIAAIAAARAIPADRLLTLLADPAAVVALDNLRAFAAIRREWRAESDRDAFITALREVVQGSSDLVEKRLAATAALRALAASHRASPRSPSGRDERRSREVRAPSPSASAARSTRQSGLHADAPSSTERVPQSHGSRPSSRPRRIADFNLAPEDAERFLERERRENDRLERLLQRAVALSDLDGPSAPSDSSLRGKPQIDGSPHRDGDRPQRNGSVPIEDRAHDERSDQSASSRPP